MGWHKTLEPLKVHCINDTVEIILAKPHSIMPQKRTIGTQGGQKPAFIDSPSWEPYVELSFRDKQESNIWGGKTHGDQKACYTYDCQSLKKFLIRFGLILINDNVNNLPNL